MSNVILYGYLIIFIIATIIFAYRSHVYSRRIDVLENMLCKTRMRFIGTDRSLGLRYGQVYDVVVWIQNNHICVGWNYRGVFSKPQCCPYSSYCKMKENWQLVQSW